jgi:predicted transcriptional regulator of viral defense system
MTTGLLLRKLRLDGVEFIAGNELKGYCKTFNVTYDATVKYFLRRGYLVRIFRGCFYLKGLEELKLGRAKYNYLELIAKGLEMKKVANWYFGLHTALKLNNMTHEYFTVDNVVSDAFFRGKLVNIVGYSVKFYKFKERLMTFGIIKDKLRYSDPEKTILDFIYTGRYHGFPDERILMDVSEYAKGISREKLMEYSEHYPKSVSGIAGRLK